MTQAQDIQRLIQVLNGDIKWPGATDTYNVMRARLYMSQHEGCSVEEAARAVLAPEIK
jgi:hypothetical protein